MFPNPLNAPKYLPFWRRRRFKQKIIVIESDDWGMEGAIDPKALTHIQRKYGQENTTRWTTDALESEEDLSALYEVLESFHGKFERGPVLTANFITHNIDYQSSLNLSFKPITQGFNNPRGDVLSMYQEGIKKKWIFPQLHGYCHHRSDLLGQYFSTREGQEDFKRGFLTGGATMKRRTSQYEGELTESNPYFSRELDESLNVFKSYFGFSPQTLIPPRFMLGNIVLPKVLQSGIRAIQACNRLLTSQHKRWRTPYFKKTRGLYFFPRTARLDPHRDYNYDAGKCLQQIERAFHSRIPACVDFHRVNFAGTYIPEYRDNTLTELKKLLNEVLRLWPDTCFLTTDELLQLCLPRDKVNAMESE